MRLVHVVDPPPAHLAAVIDMYPAHLARDAYIAADVGVSVIIEAQSMLHRLAAGAEVSHEEHSSAYHRHLLSCTRLPAAPMPMPSTRTVWPPMLPRPTWHYSAGSMWACPIAPHPNKAGGSAWGRPRTPPGQMFSRPPYIPGLPTKGVYSTSYAPPPGAMAPTKVVRPIHKPRRFGPVLLRVGQVGVWVCTS